MKSILDEHYTRLAKDYDDFLYYSPDFVRAVTSLMIDMLELKASDVLVDLACGTGMYSLDIQKQVSLDQPIVGVDPYPEMLEQIPTQAPIKKVEMDGLAFSAQPGRYDKVLIKEAIHHIAERDELFANLYERLRQGGILLLVHVPPKVQYPLFEKALERCLDWHADPDELARQLCQAGFRVRRKCLEYRHAIPKTHYFRMVENCYMSVLTSFSEAELRRGLASMEREYRDVEVLEFVDHFDYLAGFHD